MTIILAKPHVPVPQAYQNVVKQGGEPPLLPALEKFTQDQLYFIAFGQVCGVPLVG